MTHHPIDAHPVLDDGNVLADMEHHHVQECSKKDKTSDANLPSPRSISSSEYYSADSNDFQSDATVAHADDATVVWKAGDGISEQKARVESTKKPLSVLRHDFRPKGAILNWQ